jgi:hypothetical protein
LGQPRRLFGTDGNRHASNPRIRKVLLSAEPETLIVTGKYVGEGFDFLPFSQHSGNKKISENHLFSEI